MLEAKLISFVFFKLSCMVYRKWHTSAKRQGELQAVAAAQLSNMVEPLKVRQYSLQERAAKEKARSLANKREQVHRIQEAKRRQTLLEQRGVRVSGSLSFSIVFAARYRAPPAKYAKRRRGSTLAGGKLRPHWRAAPLMAVPCLWVLKLTDALKTLRQLS